jgi:signal transduction histidine kinase
MRALIYELSPPDDDSLESGLRRLADEAAGRIQLVFRAPEPPSFEARAALRRIAQEAVQNALRHAPASAVTVVCTAEQGTWRLAVQDQGPGFHPESRSAGLGLRHMRERAAAIGARLSIVSAPGQGTVVQVAWPEQPAPDGVGKEGTP